LTTITEKFSELRAKNEKALVLFVTAGDQPLADLPRIIDVLSESGADIVEVGIPFSDPFGEGPTIQASSQRSLDNGTTAGAILKALERGNFSIPLVTMGYYNTYLRLGLNEVAVASREAGVAGAIISDLVPDEGDAWANAASAKGLDTIYLAAPTSTDARISEVCNRSTGFVYAVSRTGVTGSQSEVPAQVTDLVARIKSRTDLPVCVGFGISRPEHVRMVCSVADGAVIGSSLVDLMYREWPNESAIRDYVQGLKSATLS
jgi:tryptophan synthase alpha chain